MRAILDLEPPRTVKAVQRLNGKVAALNRFVSKATDKCLPFFRILKKNLLSGWTSVRKAFEDLKKYLLSLPLLNPSILGEELFLYIAVSQSTVSAALVRDEGGSQRPVYFISRAF